jgi:plasmid stabilization system protein ParE
MGLKIYWTSFAKRELRKIFDYYKEVAGSKIARKIIHQILQYSYQIEQFPEMGAIEPLLTKHPRVYRFIICANHKIIYWINQPKSRIEILDIFDTRQNPNKLSRGI